MRGQGEASARGYGVAWCVVLARRCDAWMRVRRESRPPPRVRRRRRRRRQRLTPPPVPPLPEPAGRAASSAAGSRRLLGETIVGVDVVLDDERWPDVAPPIVASMRAGDRADGARSCGARSTRRSERPLRRRPRRRWSERRGGVRATIHVMPRKVIDAHSRRPPRRSPRRDELLRDLDLARDGELVASECPRIARASRRSSSGAAFLRRRCRITTRATDDPLRVIVLVDISSARRAGSSVA